MSERKTVTKWFWVWEFDKEERWLNQMAMEGWALCDVGFCRYTFEKCEPGEYTIRTEMRKSDPEYVSFMSDIGAEYIGRMVQWIYFRKKAEDGPFELFDLRHRRIRTVVSPPGSGRRAAHGASVPSPSAAKVF